MADLKTLNQMKQDDAFEALMKCCGSERWAQMMVDSRPYNTKNALFAKADAIWSSLSEKDWLEAFSHHPRIGGKDALRQKFAATKEWSSQEQAGVNSATEEVIDGLAKGNEAYEKKFGRVFLICATGKSASEMLNALNARLKNDPSTELKIAVEEHAKITRIRLEKLLTS